MTKSLVVIDDRSLRKAAFTKAEKLLKKLERLEGNLKTFHDTDQRLFQDWYELTFREDRKNIESLHDQYRELCRIHNWIIAIARQRDLSMPEAYAVFRDEDELYKTGSPEDKRRIAEERKRRDEFILSEVEKRTNSMNSTTSTTMTILMTMMDRQFLLGPMKRRNSFTRFRN